jgi:hypothetical protein
MKILAVRLYRGECRMVVCVEANDGRRFNIPCHWLTREMSDVPPEKWEQSVLGQAEIETRGGTKDSDTLSALRKGVRK